MTHLEMTMKNWTVQLQSLLQRMSNPPKVRIYLCVMSIWYFIKLIYQYVLLLLNFT